MKAKYRVHRFNIRMTEDQGKLEQFLNSLEGEVVAIIPNVTSKRFETAAVDFLLIAEKVS
jgi:stalled ribosome rescue protein Dom34